MNKISDACWLQRNRLQNKHWVWKGRDCLLQAFSSIYMHFSAGESESEDLRSHLVIDTFIFLQFVIFSIMSKVFNASSGYMIGVIWATYLSAVILKLLFYFVFHPWANVIKHDLKSWHYPTKGGLIWDNFSLWLQSSKKCAKYYPELYLST